MELFDTHSHLDFPEFDSDREQVIERARAQGVRYLVAIGSGNARASATRAMAIAESHDRIWATVGVHPHDVRTMKDDDLDWLRGLARRPQVVAIGEIGLDYAKQHSPRPVQLARFRDQLALARELALPVVIHDREAHADILRVFQEDGVGEAGGIMHCYSGSVEMAEELARQGWFISIPGVVTFRNAEQLRQVAARVPQDRILFETDCPFLAPAPHRGKRNEPAYVALVARAVAELRGVDPERLAAAATANAFRAFRMEKPA